MYRALIYFERAFDTLNRELIWRIVRGFGMPVKIVKLREKFYENLKFVLETNGDFSSPFI